MTVLPRRKLKQVIEDTHKYIYNRKIGAIRQIKTPWKQLNTIIGGIEPDTVILLAAQSGGGKTALQNILEHTIYFVPENKGMQIEGLTFNFEMKDINLYNRKLSSELELTTQEILSVHKQLPDSDYQRILKVADKYKDLNIEYVDTIGTVQDIKDTVIARIRELEIRTKSNKNAPPVYLLVSLDHTLLAKRQKNQSERDALVELATVTNDIKHMQKHKIYVSWILLSQTNRSLDDPERLNNPMFQFPVKSDIFGSDALWHIADVVVVLMIPYRFGIKTWGLNQMPTQDKLFMHVLKNREGQIKIAAMNENLKYNKIYE